MSLQPGKHIADNLRLVRLLGRGAMGSVWVADHLGLQSQVAVKFITPAQLEDETSVQRFRQEARAAAEIRSPHVVQTFDHGFTDDGLPYIVMEMLEGESLDKRVKRLGPLGSVEVVSIVVQACKALGKAHERGVYHRDIKPPNVFIIDSGGEPFVKVLDFGVAKFSGAEEINMTAAGNMVGTPAYMSPEQLFHGKEIDHRGDLWSLAVVTYFSLTGNRPFEGATLGELCVAIKAGEYISPTECRSDLSPDVDAWFAKAFHRDLAARFTTAKEMAQSLEIALNLSTVMQSTPSVVASSPHLATYSGTSLSSFDDLERMPRSRLWQVVGVVVGMFGLGLGGAALLWPKEGPVGVPPQGSVVQPATTGEPQTSAPDPGGDEEPDGDDESADEPGAGGEAPATSASVAVRQPPPRRPIPRPTQSAHKPDKDPPEDKPKGDERDEKAAKELGL
ncbi:MAG: serine/threonine protein kinase [Deltaproteobacteria bacterium]|nr:serine/threonine protein kinase [Deltaproteobacteria bacterium]